MTSFAGALPVERRSRFVQVLRERLDDWMRLSFRHDLLVARFVAGLQLETARRFDAQVVRPLLVELGRSLPLITTRTSGSLVADLFPEVVALRAEIERVVGRGVGEVRAVVERQMQALAQQEVRWIEGAAARLGAGPNILSPTVEATAVRQASQRVWLGDPTEKWFEKALQRPTADVARSWVTTGVKQGLTSDEIVRGLTGTRAKAGLLDRPRHTVKALVRTASTHAANSSRMDTFRALGVTHWRFLATLDHRTTLVCATNDGEVYPIGEGPIPPLHPNCRSVATPEPNPNREPTGRRAAITGQVPASATFEDWLATLPKAEQDAYIGSKAKAEAWRAGKLSLKQMLGPDLEPLSDAELRELDRL